MRSLDSHFRENDERRRKPQHDVGFGLVDPRLGRKGLHLIRQCEEMDRPVADLDLTLAVEPYERVLEPIRVVPLWIILARVY